MIIPVPNLIAGILIGIANQNWIAVIIASIIWGFVFCGMVLVMSNERRKVFTSNFMWKKGKSVFTANLNFFIIEYLTGATTAALFGSITYFIKSFFS